MLFSAIFVKSNPMVTVINRSSSLNQISEMIRKMLEGKKKHDAYKFCGSVKLKEKPLAFQKKMRNEWK
jgi:hypothetical protein